MLCKVSDFGLSRELAEDSPVYETQVHLRCPVPHSRNITGMGTTFRRRISRIVCVNKRYSWLVNSYLAYHGSIPKSCPLNQSQKSPHPKLVPIPPGVLKWGISWFSKKYSWVKTSFLPNHLTSFTCLYILNQPLNFHFKCFFSLKEIISIIKLFKV